MLEAKLDSAETARLATAADWLQRLQSAPRDEALAVEWFDWCQAAPENLAAFEKIQAIWQGFDVIEQQSQRVTRRHHRFAVPLAIAAALACVTASVWWMVDRRPQPDTLTTDVAEHGSQVLADGSQVDLGARTRIAARYTDEQRTVIVEKGEAFFDVAKEAARPFVVQAGNLRVTALGTAFSVRHTTERTVVTVSEGLVSVSPQDSSHELRAAAGERVIFSAADNHLSVASIDPGAATAWRDGVLKFVDEPLGAVINDVNRYSVHPITLDDARLRERLYTGTVYRERIDDWLRALERVYPLYAQREANGDIVITPK